MKIIEPHIHMYSRTTDDYIRMYQAGIRACVLTPERVSEMIKEYGSRRVIVNGSADWGVFDPLSLVKIVEYLAKDGHEQKVIEDLTFNNAMDFYRQSPNWKPRFDIVPFDPRTFQR